MSRFALCVARFYEELADRLEASARGALEDAGAQVIHAHSVPGAFELPLAAKYCAESGLYDAIICLGAVIRGETSHYDYVCSESARGIMEVQLSTGIPCTFGVLTCDTREQAMARAGGDKRDGGRHAAEAALGLLALKARLGKRSK